MAPFNLAHPVSMPKRVAVKISTSLSPIFQSQKYRQRRYRPSSTPNWCIKYRVGRRATCLLFCLAVLLRAPSSINVHTSYCSIRRANNTGLFLKPFAACTPSGDSVIDLTPKRRQNVTLEWQFKAARGCFVEENLFAKNAGCQKGLQPINAGYHTHNKTKIHQIYTNITCRNN